MKARRSPCDCGRPLDGAKVLTRRFRMLRSSGDLVGARGEFVTFQCECGGMPTRLWNVGEPPLHTRRAA